MCRQQRLILCWSVDIDNLFVHRLAFSLKWPTPALRVFSKLRCGSILSTSFYKLYLLSHSGLLSVKMDSNPIVHACMCLLDSGVVASAIYVDNALVHIVYGVLCILKLNHVPGFVASHIKCNMFFSFHINLLINIIETVYSEII